MDMPSSSVNNSPQVSVVVPTWNRAATIVAAVKSALAQTLAPLEVLVCDDGSEDATEAVVRMIDDARVKWLPGLRGGRPAIPRNRGLLAARGDWVAFLDSDDVWQPDKLARQFAAMRSAGTRAACCDAMRVLPDGRRAGRLLGGGNASLDIMALLRVNRVVCSSALVDAAVLARTGGFPESADLRALEDYALWLRVATITPFTYVGEALVDYTDDAATSVRAGQVNPWTQRLSVLEDFRAWQAAAADGSGPVRRRIGYEILRSRARRIIGRTIG